MRALAALIVLIAAPAALAATGTGGPDARKAVNHVRRLDKRDAFRLRERIGGAFYLGGVDCDQNHRARGLLCWYTATQRGTDAQGKRTACTIDVKVTRRGTRHTRWHRWVKVCSTAFAPPPPTSRASVAKVPLTIAAARRAVMRVQRQQILAPGNWEIDPHPSCERISPRRVQCYWGLIARERSSSPDGVDCPYRGDVRLRPRAKRPTVRARTDGSCHPISS